MSKVYLFNYNNYYNRILKGYTNTTISDYTSADTDYRVYNNINFNKNDGVNTELTINYTALQTMKDADYLIVTDESDNILSRWFIIENVWNRDKQQKLTLRRDLLVDYYDEYKNSPFFCEKGAVAHSNKLIYNSENMQFNQIQKECVKLNDNKYIVGYIDKTFGDEYISVSDSKIPIVNSRADIPVYSYIYGEKTPVQYDPDFQFAIYATNESASSNKGMYKTFNDDFNDAPSAWQGGSCLLKLSLTQYDMQDFITDKYRDFNRLLAELAYKTFNLVPASTIQAYNNTIWYCKTEGKFLRVNVAGASTYTSGLLTAHVSKSELNDIAIGLWLEQFPSGSGFPDGTVPFRNLEYRYRKANITFTDVSSSYNIGYLPAQNATSRQHTEAPYDIFFVSYSESALKTATKIASALIGSGALYDLQLLPYAPTASSKTWTIDGTTFTWASSCSNSGDMNPAGSTVSYGTDRIAKKVASNTETWRVVSPNHANWWEFNPAQNGGVSQWHWEMTAKPYQPYIHVYPTFGELYGVSPTYDARGLVCTGSFSLPVSSDKWATYQINNASYQDAFDRTIDNMSITQHYQHIGDIANALMGTVQGASIGAMYGGTTGGVIGGAISGALGTADVYMNQKLRNEAIDYAKDQFGFNLRNIQAQPRSLVKCSSFDVNYAGGVYIIKYGCSTEEENALKEKIKYNGMTLGIITTFSTVFGQLGTDCLYVKGKLIRLPNIKDDFHLANEIATELYKGVYKS